MANRRFADRCQALTDSATHGTRATIAELNRARSADARIIDLSIGSLDEPVDPHIDTAVSNFILGNSKLLHDFGPVKGHSFLLGSLAARIERDCGLKVDAEREVIATGGGIKGSITTCLQAFLNPGDEVLIPIPNWVHYSDMVRLHGATPRYVLPGCCGLRALVASDLEQNITARCKILILNGVVNPTGKVGSSDELRQIAEVIAVTNVRRHALKERPIQVLFDNPYEAYVWVPRSVTFAGIEVQVPGFGSYSMRQCTASLTGPGKTYGMHGARLGYIWADPETIGMLSRVQVNTTSFASTYAQVATHFAVQEAMDPVVGLRAQRARSSLIAVLDQLNDIPGLRISPPEGGYFLFVDFSAYARLYTALGYSQAVQFLLCQAGVAGVAGSAFAPGGHAFDHFVRFNCGRSLDVLMEACTRVKEALALLGTPAVVTL